MMRKIAKVDKNQTEIVQALRKAGATVQHLHQVGSGCPDILVGYHGRNFLLELKSEKGTLTSDEQDWLYEWHGSASVVYGIVDSLKAIGAME
jgi:hypothetical protein